MLKKILGVIAPIVMVVGGVVGGDYVKNRQMLSSSGAQGPAKKAVKDKKHSDEAAKSKKSSKKDDKSSKKNKEYDNVTSYDDSPKYLKFKRQFVVPVMENGKIDALVIMNVNYVLDEQAPDNVYSFEPKLRDAIMREMLAMSNQDVFGENLTMAKNYELLRSTLLRAGQGVLTEGIRDVLILDIARQEQ